MAFPSKSPLIEEVIEVDVHQENVQAWKIRYRSQGHSVWGFILVPKDINQKIPCLIFNRGGTKEFGVIDAEKLERIALMASWGYVVIASQYSGNGGSEGKDESGGGDVEDVLVLKDILDQTSGADIERIGMYGGSRGGMMTYMCLARVNWIKAAVTKAGLADMTRIIKLRPEIHELYERCFGGSEEEMIKRSALHWVDRLCKTAPILLMHGTSDWRVSVLDSIDLARRCYEEKVPYRLVTFEGDDHGLTKFQAESLEMTRVWFERYLKKSEELPNLETHGD